MFMAAKPKIVVLGGGFGGLESAFYLRQKLHDRADLTLVSERDYFLFKPNTIYIPFGEDPEKFKIRLDGPARRRDIQFIQGRVKGIDPDSRKVELQDREIGYDYLVVATGASMRPEEVPGLKDYALNTWAPEDMLRLREAFQRLAERGRSGERQKLLFVIPANNRCPGPVYELVMMVDTWLRQQGAREPVEITWTTFEEGFIQAFGPRLSTLVTGEFERRGIQGFRSLVVTAVEPGVVQYQNDQRLPYDVLVTLPPYVAGTTYATLPSDDRGFIQAERDSRRVQGQDRIFAVGDAANFPIKQGFLAMLQADAAADHLAAEILGGQPKVSYVPTSMCVMEQFDKATYAQVLLRYTDDPKRPVAVDAESDYYRVGSYRVWRVAKRLLGRYLGWRFGSGRPLHAGLAWNTMEFGVKRMAKVFAN